MINTLKNQFMQTAFLSTIWTTFLVNFFKGNSSLEPSFFWNIIGIGTIFGLVFGVVYPYIWNYGTGKSITNILIATVVNTVAGFLSLYLFSTEVFYRVFPYCWVVVLITLILHIISFHFYQKFKTEKLSNELNTEKAEE